MAQNRKTRDRRTTAAALVLILAATLTAAAQQPASTPGDAADRAELTRLETVWNQAHERGDSDALDHLWDDDLEVAVPRMPIINKTDALAFSRSGRMKFSRYETSALRIRPYGNSAVVTGRLQRTRVVNGREMSDDWRFTKVYVRRGDQWRVVSFHASESAPQ